MGIPERKRAIFAALGQMEADLVIKNTRVLNVFTETFEEGDLAIQDGFVVGLGRYRGKVELDGTGKTVVPGFVDGHLHLESSIVTPRQYCRATVPHGTTAIVADPHEIANVLGLTGVRYMMEECRNLPLDVYMMVPSCVPATPFDETGAVLTAKEVEELLQEPNVLGLAEMMNYPGVLACDDEVLKKIDTAQRCGKRVDGHAPRLTGRELSAYVSMGIQTEHESTTAEEALEKLSLGQWILVREGTASKNLLTMLPLFQKPYCDRCLLATDDKHPGELKQQGHIDHIIRTAIAQGVPAVNAYKMASYNAAVCFGLRQKGALAPGYGADFVILDDVDTVQIHSVYKAGKRIDNCIDEVIDSLRQENPYSAAVQKTVNVSSFTVSDLQLKKEEEKVIGLVPGEILTTDEGYARAIDLTQDICKLAVVERHRDTGHTGVAFVKGYGLKSGAIATSVAHDSHNLIVAGANDADMVFAVERLKALQGGMVVVENGAVKAELALPIAGLMCDLDGIEAEEKLNEVKAAAYALGVGRDIDPFMTLSFSSLAVIPTLRLTTLGVVDVTRFKLLK